jgi:uncharacterized delta-60 repeat protein
MQPLSSPTAAPWIALAELTDGLPTESPLPPGTLFQLALRQYDGARVAPDSLLVSKLPPSLIPSMALPLTPASDDASNSLASTLLGFVSRHLAAPRARAARMATLAVLACLAPASAFATGAGPRTTAPTYQEVTRVLASKLGRVPAPALVRGVMNALPMPAGDLDTSFDTDGKQTVSFGGTDQGRAIVVDGSGRVVVAGYTSRGGTGYDFAVARLTSAGALDTNFDGDGTQTVDFGGDDRAYALALDASGNIVVVGGSGGVGAGFSNNIAVARLTSAGDLDTNFDTDGRATVGIFGQDEAHGVAIQSDGKIVVVGTGYNGGHRDFVVARFNTDGSLDTGFDTDGKFNDGFGGGNNDWGEAVVIQSDQKIVVGGYANVGGYKFAVLRLNTDGTLDTDFDTDGKQLIDFGGVGDEAHALALDGSGNVLIAGFTSAGAGSTVDFAVARLTSAGALDTNFDTDGKQTVDFGTTTDRAYAMALDGSGRIVLAGNTGNDFGVARLTSSGVLDTGFSTDGLVSVDFGGSESTPGMTLDADGDVLLAGYTTNGAEVTHDFAVARLLGTPLPPSTPTLSAPADNATGVSRTPTFSWSDGGAGVTYTLLIEPEGGGPTTLVKSGITTNSYTLSGVDAPVGPTDELLSAGTGYRWRVQATNEGGSSSFAASRGFTTLAVPGAPTLTAPADEAVNQATSLSLTWDAPTTGGAASGYSVEVRLDDASGAHITGSPFTTATTSQAISGLANSQLYFWRVTPTNASGNGTAASRTFTTVPPPPTVATGAASDLTGVSATVAGTVNPNGAATTYVFRYGTASDLTGASTAPGTPGDAGSGTSAGAVSTGLTGLTGGTTYYYRLEATSVGGTSNGTILSFATDPAPSVTTTAATGVTSSAATLNGTFNPNDDPTTYYFQYGTAADLTGATSTDPQGPASGTTSTPATQALTGLASGTRYYYRLVAANSAGTTNGTILSFWTDVVAPTALAPTGTVSLEPTLDWADQTGVTAYSITIDNDSNLGVDATDTTPPVTVSAGTTSQYGIVNPAVVLANGTTYYWQASATGSSGVTATSATSSFTTTAATITPVLNYPSTGVTANARDLRFSWSPGTTNSRYTYRLQVDQSPPDWLSLAANSGVVAASPYTVALLTEGTGHAWRVATYDATLDDVTALAGTTLSFTAPVAFTTSGSATPPTPIPSYPSGGATVYSATATLSFYLGASATGLTFDVRYRNTTDGVAYPATASAPAAGSGHVTGLSALQLVTATLTPGKAYAWSARSCRTSTGVCSAWSSDATFAMNATAGGTVVPTAPVLSYPTGGVTVYGSPIRLTWYLTGSATGLVYRVYTYECTTVTCTDAPAVVDANTDYTATGDLASTRYDLAVTPGKSYAWYARSHNSGGTQSAASARHSFVVAGTSGGAAVTVVPSWPTGGATVYTLTPTLSWYLSGSSSGVTGYQVCFGTAATAAGNASCAAPASVSGVATTSYVVPAGQLTYGTTYHWFVRTIGSTTWATASFAVTGGGGTTVPVTSWPNGGATVWSASQSLSWYLTGSSAGITSYEGELTRVGGTTTPFSVTAPTRAYSATGLVGGASYTWRVRACAGTTCGSYSTAAAFSVHSSVGGGGAPMPFAESPAAGVVITGSAPPVLSWSLPVEGLSALMYEVEVSQNAQMTNAQRLSWQASPYVALRSLPAGTHYWRVRSRDAEGRVSSYSPVEVFTTTSATALEEEAAVPTEFTLASVYPNPLSQAATVRFGLPEPVRVRVVLYDALGREAAVVVDGELPAGMHRVALDGAGLAGGLYVVRLSAS